MNNFQWRTDLNEVHDLGDKVNYKVFSDGGENVELTFDNVNYMKPNTQKDGVYGWDITLPKDGKMLQDFWIKQWGCLAVPYSSNETTTTTTHKQEEQGNKTIQLLIFQNCSNDDGVHFRAEVVLPDNNTNSYDFEIINIGGNDDAQIDKTGHNSWVIRNHENHKNGFFKVIVKRNDCKPCVYESYSTTCNHEGDPTNCPENQRVLSVVGGSKLLKNGEVFNINVQGNITCDNVTYNTNVKEIDKTTFQITGFPFKLHYQPSCGDACHGWTELYQETE